MDQITNPGLSNNQEMSQNFKRNVHAFTEEPFELCRLCARSTKKTTYIFNDSGDTQLEFKINAYLPVTVKKTDPLPKQLCLTCVSKLNMVSEFAEDCIKAEDKLKNCVKANLFRSHTVSIGQDLLDETKQIDPHKMMSRVLGTNLMHKQAACGHSSYGSRSFINCYTCPLCSLGVMTSDNDPQTTY